MNDNSEMNQESYVPEMVDRFRNQALCIKTNIQVLRDIWDLQQKFKERDTGAFYQIIQDNCIFRIILETYKMLYDSMRYSINIFRMANTSYRKMIEMTKFEGREQELREKKKKLSADLKKYTNVETFIKENRNKVYAHNDSRYHWFKEDYVKKWGMTDQIYDEIMEMADICIEYCNDILKMFNYRSVYEYSNHDDIKRLFGLKTDSDKEKERLNYYLDNFVAR